MAIKIILFLDKEELDKLSYDEIMAYRTGILTNDIPDWNTYIDELELYTDIRFKERVIARYDNWRKKSIDSSTEELDRSAMALILSLQPDSEKLYRFFTDGKLQFLKPYKYIQFELSEN